MVPIVAHYLLSSGNGSVLFLCVFGADMQTLLSAAPFSSTKHLSDHCLGFTAHNFTVLVPAAAAVLIPTHQHELGPVRADDFLP